MTSSSKIIRAICLTAVFLWAAPYLFFYVFGKNIIVDQLERNLGKSITAGSYALTPAFRMELRDIVIVDIGTIKSLIIQPSLASFVTPQIVFNSIVLIRPVLTIIRTPSMVSVSQSTPQKPPVVSIMTLPVFVMPGEFPVLIRQLTVADGTVHWIDKMVKGGVEITINNIYAKVKNVTAANFAIVPFEIRGMIPWRHGAAKGTVQLSGWINFSKNDIQAKLVVFDIDAVALQPYYIKYFDLEKARIEKAKLFFSSEFMGLDNDIAVHCGLELSDIKRVTRDPEEVRERDARIADSVINRFKAIDGDKMHLEFSFKTRMDRPEFGLGILKSALVSKLRSNSTNYFKPEEVVFLPGRILAGVMKGAAEVSKALVDVGFSVGTEVKKTVGASFDREKSN